MNWFYKFNNIFKEKEDKENYKFIDKYELPQDVLSPSQIKKALAWYDIHKNHVDKMIVGVSMFPPHLYEDKIDPRLWKPEHWKWFISLYHFL